MSGTSQDDAVELGAGFDEMIKEDILINGIFVYSFSEYPNGMKGYASKTLYKD